MFLRTELQHWPVQFCSAQSTRIIQLEVLGCWRYWSAGRTRHPLCMANCPLAVSHDSCSRCGGALPLLPEEEAQGWRALWHRRVKRQLTCTRQLKCGQEMFLEIQAWETAMSRGCTGQEASLGLTNRSAFGGGESRISVSTGQNWDEEYTAGSA